MKHSPTDPLSTGATFWCTNLPSTLPQIPLPRTDQRERSASAGMYTEWTRKYHSLTQCVSTFKSLSQGIFDKLKNPDDKEQ